MHTTTDAERVMERCDILGAISEEPDRLTRRFATPALQRVNELVLEWMRAAGMVVRQDTIGNLIGHYEAAQAGAKTLLLGSHLDSVRDAGKYDGPLGVLAALACVERLHAQGRRLSFAIELVAFADEEGLRYSTAYLGSQAYTGVFDPEQLHLADKDGITLADAIRAMGGDPAAIPADQRTAGDLIGYCELHIEQGPVLEALDLPVGVVTAISAQSRFQVRFTGVAGHAGTVPMAQRHDALCAAAEFILATEGVAQETRGLVATVGQVTADPGAGNVIPGLVRLSLDVRHQEATIQQQACYDLYGRAQQIAARRGVALDWELIQMNAAVPCSPELAGLLARSIESLGYPAHFLPSGAGHDSVMLKELTAVAMLFVRCRAGVSHNPAESVTTEDVAVALDVLERFLELLAEQ